MSDSINDTPSVPEITKKPDPTFLKGADIDLRQPLGLAIEERQQVLENDPKGPRLSRKEFETMLDDYYTLGDDQISPLPGNENHARIAGGRMVRNLALASCLALFFGFGLGLYGLSQQGGETQLGQQFNKSLAGLWQYVQPGETSTGSDKTKLSKQSPSSFKPKPIKTASLVVGDASGTIQAGIPLKLSLDTDVDLSLMEVKIMNVPDDAVLTAGTRRHDGVWILQPAELNNVALVVSSDRKAPLRLDIELVETKTGELLSPTREIRVAILQPRRLSMGGL